jgi:AcrR family transcriptional regulator
MKTKKSLSPKGEETKKQILESAMACFMDEGFEATTLRKLAQKNKMSLGSFYYYFPSKDAIVLEFYQASLEHFVADSNAIFKDTRNFEARLERVFKARIESMSEGRPLWRVLAKMTADPASPLSPFSKETQEIREASIQVFNALLEDSTVKPNSKIARQLPELLWMIMMGVIFFWIFDSSKHQERTTRLIETVAKNVGRLLKALNIPVVGEYLLPLKEILSLFPERFSNRENA